MSPSSAALLDRQEPAGPQAGASSDGELPTYHSTVGPLADLSEQRPDLQESRIYRGRTVEELIPRIESELGADAIVLRRRKGLSGGIGGFFQRPFVEIEARRGTARFDMYDEATGTPALPPSLESLAAHEPASPAPGARPAVTRPAGGTYVTGPLLALAAAGSREILGEAHNPSLMSAEETFSTPASGLMATEPTFAAAELRELDPDELAPQPLPLSTPEAREDPFAAALAAAETAVAHEFPDLPSPVEISAARGARPVEPNPELDGAPRQPDSAPRQGDAAPRQPDSASRRAQASIEATLVDLGISAGFAAELVDSATAHVTPLEPRLSLARAVHRAVTQRIPACAPLPSAGASIAVIGAGGSGKTGCCAALLGAYRKSSTLPARCASILAGPERGELELLLSPDILTPTPVGSGRATQVLAEARANGLLLLDMPGVSPADRGAVRTIAKLLSELKPDRVVLALPATMGAKPMVQLLEAFRPLRAHALAITHAEETDQLGVAIEAACKFGLAPEYLLDGSRNRGGLSALDPTRLADRLLS
jgi:flagellar biosynthesis GTPase FlhF